MQSGTANTLTSLKEKEGQILKRFHIFHEEEEDYKLWPANQSDSLIDSV
jgi:hypothetical protein